MNSNYITGIEKQNEELQQSLAKCQKKIIEIPNSLYLFEEVCGYGDSLTYERCCAVTGTRRLKILADYAKHRSIINLEYASLNFLGYSISTPDTYFMGKHEHKVKHICRYFFDTKFNLIEGWEYKKEIKTWIINQDYNGGIFNIEFLTAIGVWGQQL